MKENRGSWYLLTAAVLGIGLGLIFSWAIFPVEYVDTPPVSLRDDYKGQYREMIAVAYAATGNLQRAKDRLGLLGDENSVVLLVSQAQQTLAGDGNFEEAQALANLAASLGQVPTRFPTQLTITDTSVPPPTQTYLATDSPTPSATPTQTIIPIELITETSSITQTSVVTSTIPTTLTLSGTVGPRITSTLIPFQTPTPTPTATLLPPFVLDNLAEVCNPLIDKPLIQVFVSNLAGIGIPGIEIVISWNGGEEHIYTGIKSDIDIGYADFEMLPKVFYVIQVSEGGQLITDLTAPQCTDEEGNVFWGSLRLVFSHP